VRAVRTPFPWLVIAGVLVASLSLRGPILSVTPVLRQIERDLGLDAATASLLTTLPVLAFAAITPFAAIVVRRAGAEAAMMACLVAVAAGTLIRALPGFGWMLAGMVVIGAGITIGNVVAPVIIGRDVPPRHVATVTAAYTAALNAGSLLTTSATAAVALVTGWSLALLVWISLTLLGIALWALHMWRVRLHRRSVSGEAAPVPAASADAPRAGRALRHPVLWLLTAALASQTAIYYGISTWLPAMLGDLAHTDAATSGAFASVFQGIAIVGPFLVPALARRLPLVVPAAVIGGCAMGFAFGMLLAPQLFLLWTVLGGIAHSGGFVLIFTSLVAISRSNAETATMSAIAQTAGYVTGAASAPLLGWLHESSVAWVQPLLVVSALSVVVAVCLVAGVARVARR
jgi:CP family cyanate transporter-like MFS transporter